LERIHKISTIAILAAIIGIITIGPAMADKDSSEGHNKIDICHLNEDGKYVELYLPEEKAKGHAKNHINDIIPAEDGCPEQDESETESDDDINMNEFMEDLTRHDEVLTEITNSECSPGEMVTGFGPNGELLCSPDNVGEDNTSNIISRTDTVQLQSNSDLSHAYSCESGEIILGGLIEIPSLNTPLSNEGEIFSTSEQVFNVQVFNNSPNTVTVNVAWLCYSVI
jgi:hypothetical protein